MTATNGELLAAWDAWRHSLDGDSPPRFAEDNAWERLLALLETVREEVLIEEHGELVEKSFAVALSADENERLLCVREQIDRLLEHKRSDSRQLGRLE